MAKPTGTVYLCANALIDNNYSSTIDFKNPSEQLAYWGNLVKFSISNFSYIRRTQQFLKVHKPLKDLDNVNYMYFRAEEDSKLYYCFITSKEYVDDSTSYIYFETDVLQSYMFDWELKTSYVLQEHVDRWDVNHDPIFSRTDESLAYGSEYVTESAYRVSNTGYLEWYLAILKPDFAINSASETSGSNITRISKIANPYRFLLLPATKTNEDIDINLVSGTNKTPVKSVGEFQRYIAGSDLGDFVIQILKLPYLPFEYGEKVTYTELTEKSTQIDILFTTNLLNGKGKLSLGTISVGNLDDHNTFITIDKIDGNFVINESGDGLDFVNEFFINTLAEMDVTTGIENALPSAEQWAEVKAKPYNVERDRRFESKLLCYPYRYNVLSDWKNQPIIFKNEYIAGDKIRIKFIQGITTNATARYWLDNYRKDPEGRYHSLTQNFQEDVPIITDMYYTYMLQNRNQLQADRTNAITGIFAGALGGTVSGAIAGASAGGPAGGIIGGLTSGVGTLFNGGINYSQMIRSQNAKQQDLSNLPDNITSSNDSAFNTLDRNTYLSVYRKKICCEFEEMIADVFNTSGYTVNRMKVPNLRSRLRFNYIKTLGANIVGSFNQDDLAKIKAIFNNGVTFWHYNNVNFKPFDYSLENIEVNLI